MSNKILIVSALACLSAVAVAQSDQGKDKDKAPTQAQTEAPQDAASAETAKRMHKPITVTAEVGVQGAASKPTGKTASDDWQTPAAKTTQQPKITENNKSRVAPADVNGDGKADVAAPKAPVQATSASSTSLDVKSPRDIASGQSSGKLQQAPVPPTKETDAKPKQK